MTKEEARAALAARPEHQRSLYHLQGELAYERRYGLHTYHACACGRGACRAERCVTCLEELLAALSETTEETTAT